MSSMKQSILFLFVVFVCLLSSCSQTEEYTFQGTVSGVETDTLFLEKVELGKIEIVAYQVLKKNGKFSFSFPRAVEPHYVRLRLQQGVLYLVADSTETISVYSNKQTFGQADSIVGSAASKRMQSIVHYVAQTQRKMTASQEKYQRGKIVAQDFTEETTQLVRQLKDFLRKEVYQDTRSSVAYFALYQQINGYYVFNPYDKEDVKVYAAVATPLQVHYPQTARAKNIEDVVLKGMQRRKNAEDKLVREIVGKGFIDISLSTVQGVERSLSASLGRATIVDFSLFQSENSYAHTVLLQELYRVYASKGLRIYQVSFDDDAVFSVVAKQLPYTVVHDKKGLVSPLLQTYNISTLPTVFLLDKEGDIVARNVSLPLLEQSIQQLLEK